MEKKNFHRSQIFDKLHDGVNYLADKSTPGEQSRYPSIYSYDDEPRIPAWIAYDGQRLTFKGFFQESVQERWKSSYQIRIVKICFFLEDGTIKIVEPCVCNSGLEQGVLVRRQRIPMPDPVRYRFYDIIDLNIGKEPEIYGRVYKIIDCDKFTRIFLNRMGIPVPDPIDCPNDPYIQQKNIPVFPKKPNRKVDTLGKFLKYDGIVLKFSAYWDDSDSEFGLIHSLELRYYLADDKIEIIEILPSNIGKSCVFLKKIKIPKFFNGIDPIGINDPFTVLNLCENGKNTYYIPDSLNPEKKNINNYYKDSDLAIGTRINVFGREVVITDLDSSTKNYYRSKYGIEEFKPIEKPVNKNDCCNENNKKEPPPYNGFGSYDDSLGNCYKVIPKPPKGDYIRFFNYDKQAYDSQVLRFRAKMISNNPDNNERNFIIQIYLMDNEISIFELAVRNTGFQRCLFQKKMKILIPGEKIYSSKKPKYYEPQDFFIGACLNLCEFFFLIISADIYTLRYMEINSNKFSKSNYLLIMNKIKEALKPIYKQFLNEYQPVIYQDNGIDILSYDKLKNGLFKYLKNEIVEHEIITIARKYSIEEKDDQNSREFIRSLVHTELQRLLWNDLDRLEEDIKHWDPTQSRFLSRNDVYTLLRGSRIPVDQKLLNCMINHLKKNSQDKIDCDDLLEFLNVKINPIVPIPPISIKTSLETTKKTDKNQDSRPNINWNKFLNDLNIKKEDLTSAITNN